MPRPGPRTTYRFSNEFKATAVRLSELPGVEVQDVAASLYIHPFMLSRWRKDAREGRIVTKDVKLDREVAAELKELRKWFCLVFVNSLVKGHCLELEWTHAIG
jgi:transposase